MADTIRGDFGDTPCSDCGEKGGVYLRHWGPLVPAGADGFFDGPCIAIRRHEIYTLGHKPAPLGQQWPKALRAAAERALQEDKSLNQVLEEDAERLHAASK